ncbi:iron-sulfur cluster assembly accessory protein [Nitzschia inconspicua]|uniref:Iron-sulfur cluster assembly accessory protein n=1 Tax=Nitzschia inconspicua TaxID=303405 RepID=A0A9K3LCJ3_9STRA|nr:iron-sulfur cluster assembly accessory protein [Nitzschia inconspicua]
MKKCHGFRVAILLLGVVLDGVIAFLHASVGSFHTSIRTTTTVPFTLQSTTDATVEEVDFEAPEDAVINIKPKAMQRLRELREREKSDSLVLRMGVRNGGCSGLSYVMDFSTEDDIQEDDAVDEYPGEKLKCVVDAKSMLYLYGLELDYSDELIGGGFKFYNPNAEESCGCGSSFGV